MENITPYTNTDGGDFYIFASSQFFQNDILLPPADYSINSEQPGNILIKSILFANIAALDREADRKCKTTALGRPEEREKDERRCYDASMKAQDELLSSEAEYIDILKDINPIRGEIHKFEYDANSETDGGFPNFISAILSREAMMQPAYSITNTSIILANVGFGPDEGVIDLVQWANWFTEELVRSAVYNVSTQLLVRAKNADITTIFGATPLSRHTNLAALMLPSGPDHFLEKAASQLLCQGRYENILQSNRGKQYWFNLTNFSLTICGVNEIDGKSMLVSPNSIDKNLEAFRDAVAVSQQQELQSKIAFKIEELKSIQIDQSVLINDLRRYSASTYYEERIEKMARAVRAAEEIAKKPNIFDVAGVATQLAKTYQSFASGYGGWAEFSANLPQSGKKDVAKYYWDNRGKLKEITGQVESGISGAKGALDEINRWRSRRDNEARASQLRNELNAVNIEFDGVLSDIKNRASMYRINVSKSAYDIREMQQMINSKHGSLASIIGDIVNINVFSFGGTGRGPSELEQCASAIRQYSASSTSASDSLISGCLAFDSRLADTRACIKSANWKRFRYTKFNLGDVSVYVSRGNSRHCFE